MNYENEKDFFPCKKDGSKLNIVEKIGFVAVNIVILLGLGIGVLVVSLLCAIILSDSMSGQIDFWHAFYIVICDGRLIAFGLLVGCLFWLGELAG